MLNRDSILADNRINFLLSFPIDLRMFQHLVKSEGEHAGRRFMASNEEGNQIVDDALVTHMLAGFGIDPFEHCLEEILALYLPFFHLLFSGLQNLLGRPLHQLDIFFILDIITTIKQVWKRPHGFASAFSQE